MLCCTNWHSLREITQVINRISNSIYGVMELTNIICESNYEVLVLL